MEMLIKIGDTGYTHRTIPMRETGKDASNSNISKQHHTTKLGILKKKFLQDYLKCKV